MNRFALALLIIAALLVITAIPCTRPGTVLA